MSAHAHILVVDDDKRLRDLIARRFEDGRVISVRPDDTLLTAFQRMRLADVSQLPVMGEDGKVVGIVAGVLVVAYLGLGAWASASHKIYPNVMMGDTNYGGMTEQQVAEQLTAHDALAAHSEIELGIEPGHYTNPWSAAIASARASKVGSSPIWRSLAAT